MPLTPEEAAKLLQHIEESRTALSRYVRHSSFTRVSKDSALLIRLDTEDKTQFIKLISYIEQITVYGD